MVLTGAWSGDMLRTVLSGEKNLSSYEEEHHGGDKI
jgi:hypothetical protein